ncbi:MAG: N-acetylmuramoyl-L-alanine amidase [Acidimicrobiia bacterium]
MTLLDDLRNAGLTVRPTLGWETNTNRKRDRREIVGIVNHWDANPGEPDIDHYLRDNRFGGILYHILIRRSGLVELLSQRYVWHAGKGDSLVLESLRRGEVPPPPNDSYDADGKPLSPINSGNPYTWGVAINYHPDEGPIPVPQYRSLVKVNAVLVRFSSLSTNQIIDHRHWTTRKQDIDTMSLANFRLDVGRGPTPTIFTQALTEDQWRALYQAGVAHSSSEDTLIDYWVTRAAERSPEEWANAAASIITAIATKPPGDQLVKRSELDNAVYELGYLKAGLPIVPRRV